MPIHMLPPNGGHREAEIQAVMSEQGDTREQAIARLAQGDQNIARLTAAGQYGGNSYSDLIRRGLIRQAPTSGMASKSGRYVWKSDGGVRDLQSGIDYSANSIPEEARADLGPNPYQGGFRLPSHAGAESGGEPSYGATWRPNGPPTAAGQGQPQDAYAAFKAAYAGSKQESAFGKLDQDKLNSNTFLQELPNELFRLLPKDRLSGFSTERLAKLPNEDVIDLVRSNPNLVGGFPASKWKSFPSDFVQKEIIPHLQRTGQGGLADEIGKAVGAGASAGASPAPVAATPSPGVGGGASPVPVVAAPAERVQGWQMPRMALPTNIDNSSPLSSFQSYVGRNGRPLPSAAPGGFTVPSAPTSGGLNGVPTKQPPDVMNTMGTGGTNTGTGRGSTFRVMSAANGSGPTTPTTGQGQPPSEQVPGDATGSTDDNGPTTPTDTGNSGGHQGTRGGHFERAPDRTAVNPITGQPVTIPGRDVWVPDPLPRTGGRGRSDSQTALDLAHADYYQEIEKIRLQQQEIQLQLGQARLELDKAVQMGNLDEIKRWHDLENQWQQKSKELDLQSQTADRALKAGLGYAESRRADTALNLQRDEAAGYLTNTGGGEATLGREKMVSDAERANLEAQAAIGNQAAQIQLRQIDQAEQQREFNNTFGLQRSQFEAAQRANPASLFDKVYNTRDNGPTPQQPQPQPLGQGFTPPSAGFQDQTEGGQGRSFVDEGQASASEPSYRSGPVREAAAAGGRWTAASVPAAPQPAGGFSATDVTGTGGAEPTYRLHGFAQPQPQAQTAAGQYPVASPSGYHFTPPKPLTYNEIDAQGAGGPGVTASMRGTQMGGYHPAGGVPNVSLQSRNMLNPNEQAVQDALLRTTGNDPNDYWNQQRRLQGRALGSGGGFSAPRPAGAAF